VSRIGVEIEGIKQLSNALKRFDPEVGKELKLALKSCADFLISKARPEVPTLTGAAARSLKSRAIKDQVKVAAGGRSAPYYAWLDFGGKVGRNKSVVRPFLKRGRYLYPTMDRNQDAFNKILVKALRDATRKSGLGEVK